MNIKYTVILILAFLLVSCASSTAQRDNIASTLEEINKTKPDVVQLEGDYFVDQNFDGKSDFYTKYFEFSYVMFFDRDFDGNPDEKYEYDISNDFLLDGRLDQNFDGYFETQAVMHQGILKYELVDSNFDHQIDIVKYYESGVLKRMEVYTETLNLNAAEIKTFYFNFGIPFDSKIESIKMNPKEFHLKQIKKNIPQAMYQ